MNIPTPSGLIIRTSLIYLITGFTIGGLILWSKVDASFLWAWSLFSVHIDFLLFGWTFQFVLGVAYWILPRFPKEPIRGPLWPIWLSFILLNSGLLVNLLSSLFPTTFSGMLISRIFIMLSVMFFITAIYGRVRPFLIYTEQTKPNKKK